VITTIYVKARIPEALVFLSHLHGIFLATAVVLFAISKGDFQKKSGFLSFTMQEFFLATIAAHLQNCFD
jgi:hypothetical protein